MSEDNVFYFIRYEHGVVRVLKPQIENGNTGTLIGWSACGDFCGFFGGYNPQDSLRSLIDSNYVKRETKTPDKLVIEKWHVSYYEDKYYFNLIGGSVFDGFKWDGEIHHGDDLICFPTINFSYKEKLISIPGTRNGFIINKGELSDYKLKEYIEKSELSLYSQKSLFLSRFLIDSYVNSTEQIYYLDDNEVNRQITEEAKAIYNKLHETDFQVITKEGKIHIHSNVLLFYLVNYFLKTYGIQEESIVNLK